MKIEQRLWTPNRGWDKSVDSEFYEKAAIVFIFGSSQNLQNRDLFHEIRSDYPYSRIVGCSTAGEIHKTRVYDDSLILTALIFENTQIELSKINVQDTPDSFHAGAQVARKLSQDNLTHVLVFSEGL